MLSRFPVRVSRHVRQFATKQKEKLGVIMDEETYRRIDNEELKARKHPGRVTNNNAALPDWLKGAVAKLLEDMPKPTIIADGEKLYNFLNGRRAPPEVPAVVAKYAEIRAEIAAARKKANESEKSIEDMESKDKNTALRLLKPTFHAWSPVNYNRYAGLLYLVARGGPDYAVLHRIFHEIKIRDENFVPKSFMDFGCGVGTSLWAASQFWPRAIKEHMCIESSDDMSDLMESIIAHAKPKIDNVFCRQYIPLSNKTYDIVVSSYTLMELPNMQTRLQTIGKLWARTERYLILVEQGTNAGFKMINEARDFLIHMEEQDGQTNPRRSIFSPCPNDLKCPRYATDNTPCNFEVCYHHINIGRARNSGTERFSYIVLKKGDGHDETQNWPRIVRQALVRSKHTVCRMCTADGNLKEIVFTASKHGKWMHWCARSSKWGDRLPIEIKTEIVEEEIGDEGRLEEHGEEVENNEDDEKLNDEEKDEDMREKKETRAQDEGQNPQNQQP